jgi:hypothetical protein
MIRRPGAIESGRHWCKEQARRAFDAHAREATETAWTISVGGVASGRATFRLKIDLVANASFLLKLHLSGANCTAERSIARFVRIFFVNYDAIRVNSASIRTLQGRRFLPQEQVPVAGISLSEFAPDHSDVCPYRHLDVCFSLAGAQRGFRRGETFF